MAYTNPYLAANKDVASAYASNGQGMSQDQYAQWHYQNYGQNEGRASYAAAPAAASSTPASGVATTTPSTASTNGTTASTTGTTTTPATSTGLLAATAAQTAAATPATSTAATTSTTSANQLPDDATTEGRINGLLATDSNGNYTNQVVRQAVDRANQSYAAKGLVNSSMAAQAGQEAAISQAAGIASSDAAAQATLNATSTATTETLRQNYLAAAQSVSAAYQSNVAAINSSNMTPADKTVAIAQAASARDGEMTYTNNLYAAQPNWQSAWLAVASPTAGTAVSSITNTDTLANIANDPAQSADNRAAAAAQLAAVNSQNASNATTSAATTAAEQNAINLQNYYNQGSG